VLQTDLASTQLDYNNIRQRLSQSSLQSQTQQTNVAVLSPAFEPDKPSKPRILLNILVSIFLGGLIGIGVAMQMEVMDRRIRSEEDLVGLGIPVLGVLTAEQPLSRAGWKFWHFRWPFWHRTKAVS
jgi:succinoglycan biosynthesis transport protein ExoP